MMTHEEMVALLEEHAAYEHAYEHEKTMTTMPENCYQEHVGLGLRVDGQAPTLAYYQDLFGAFPDLALERDGMATAPNHLVIWGTMNVTMTGPWLGLPATGRSVAVPTVVVLEFGDDVLVGEALYYDGASFCGQLGHSLEDVLSAVDRLDGYTAGRP